MKKIIIYSVTKDKETELFKTFEGDYKIVLFQNEEKIFHVRNEKGATVFAGNLDYFAFLQEPE